MTNKPEQEVLPGQFWFEGQDVLVVQTQGWIVTLPPSVWRKLHAFMDGYINAGKVDDSDA